MVATTNEAYRLNVAVDDGGAAEQDALIYSWDFQELNIFSELTAANGFITEQNVIVSEFDDTGSGPVETVLTPIKVRALKFGFFFDEQDLNLSQDATATFFFETNTVLTESVQATIDAYTGITFDDTLDQITLTFAGGTPVNNMDRLYDACHSRYSKSATPPQYDWLEVVGSRDKQNYVYDYDIILNSGSAVTFDLQGRSLVQSNGAAFPAAASNSMFTNGTLDFLLMVTGSSGNTITDVNVTQTLQFQINGTYTWDGGQINNITVLGGVTAVTLILLNGAAVTGTVPPEVTIQNNVSIDLTITDETDGSPLTQARGFIEAAAGGPLAEGTVILSPTNADGSGVISGIISIPSNQPFRGLIAEHGSPGLYVAKPITGTISSTSGLTQTISLVRDE